MNDINSLISIIVSIYNVEEYLPRCLDSLMRQTYRKIEVLLVDDGSTDRSGQICDKIVQKDSRFRVIHQKNQGLSAARNAALAEIRGDWVLFVDGDDALNLYAVEILEESGRKNDVDVIHFEYKNSDGKDEFYLELPSGKELEKRTGRDAAKYCLTHSGDIVVWNKMYRSSMFAMRRFSEGQIHEDEHISYKLMFEAGNVMYISHVLYSYSIRNNSIMRLPFNANKMVLIDINEERIKYFENKGDAELTNISVTEYFNILRGLYVLCARSNEKNNYQTIICDLIQKWSDRFLVNPKISAIHKMIIRGGVCNSRLFEIYCVSARFHQLWRSLRQHGICKKGSF